MNISRDLEQLRNDYAKLKMELGRQEITNERLIRESIRKDLKFIDKKKWIGVPAFLLISMLMPYLQHEIGLRMPFVVATIVMMGVLAIANFVRLSAFDGNLVSMMSTQEFLGKIKKQKQQQFNWIKITFPVLAIWVGCFVGECLHADLPKEILYSLFGGLTTGLVIGIILGFRMHNRIIGIYEGIILQLEHPEQ